MTEITMPRLSDSMEEGTVLRWLKAIGETVSEGEELVEIETEKATIAFESPEAGVLGDPVPEGATCAVGAVIATVRAGGPSPTDDGGAGEKADASPAAASTAAAVAAPVTTPSQPVPASSKGASVEDSASTRRTPATPLARRVAVVHDVDLTTVSGTGPRGRITRSDVAAAAGLPVSGAPASDSGSLGSPPRAAQPTGSSAAPSPGYDGGADKTKTVQELSRAQQVIARRMAQSKATVPHFQVQTIARLDALLALRGQLKEQTDQPPSINDFIIKACGLALREFPLANGSYRDGGIELHDRVNIGVAVATDEALIVPTVIDADSRSVGAIARETRRLANAVREGSVTPAELANATFTISNLGMYGMTAITPVVNVPQAAILGVGAGSPALRRIDGEITEVQLMTLTLSCDHRILYGANAAQFLSRVQDLIETPLLLAL